MNLVGKTIEWDGWWFDIDPQSIRARTAIGRPGIGADLEFRFNDMRDCVVFNNIRLIMRAINVGASIRGNGIRDALGVHNENRFNKADVVWDHFKPKYWIVYTGVGYERREWQ